MKKLKFLSLCLVFAMALSAFGVTCAAVPAGNTLLKEYRGLEALKYYDKSGDIVSGLTLASEVELPWKNSTDTGYYISGTTEKAVTYNATRAGYAEIQGLPGAVKTYRKITLEFDFMLTTDNTQVTVRRQLKKSSGSDTDTNLKFTAGTDVVKNRWYSAAVTYGIDGTDSSYSIYLNGKLFSEGKAPDGVYGMSLLRIQPVTNDGDTFGMYLDNIVLHAGDAGYTHSTSSPVLDAGQCSVYDGAFVISEGYTAEKLLSELTLAEGAQANVYDAAGNEKTGAIEIGSDFVAVKDSDGVYTYYDFKKEKFSVGEISSYAVSSAGIKTTDSYDDGTFYASADAKTEFCNKDFTVIIAQYDGNSKLLGISASTQAVYNSEEKLTASLKLKKDSTKGFVKAFVWTDSLKPLAETYSMTGRYSLESFEDVKPYFPGYRLKAVTFSLDDCIVQDTRVMQILDKYGLKGTFNLWTSKFHDKDETTRQTVFNRYNNHHEVASHSYTHPAFYVVNPNGELDGTGMLQPYMTYEQVIADLETSINDIDGLFGFKPQGLAWPRRVPSLRSDYEDILKYLSEQGIKYARSISNTSNYNMPSDWLKWDSTCYVSPYYSNSFDTHADKFLGFDTNSELALLSAWGHATDFTSEAQWQTFDDACAKFKDRDDVWKATNIDICLYDIGVKSLDIDLENQVITNSSDVDIYVIIDNVKAVVPANTTVTFK